MKNYMWVYNIRCDIKDGKAELISEDAVKKKCNGACYACAAFLGVDPKDVGEPFYCACCDPERMNKLAA